MRSYFIEAMLPVLIIVISSMVMVSCVAGVITGKNPVAAMRQMGYAFFFANKCVD